MALRRTLVALLALLLAAAVTLGLVESSATAGTVPTYTWNNSGSTVKIKNGTVFRIKLRTAADGGYSWTLTHGRRSNDFTILSRRVVSPTGVVGGYAQTIYTIRATHRGTDYISAVERRPFDKADVIGRFKLTITVVRR